MGKFTSFDALELAAVVVGLGVVASIGNREFGLLGAVAGGGLGAPLGRLVGRVPYAFASAAVKRGIRRSSTPELRKRLEAEYYLSHLIIAELVVRGEPIESFRTYAHALLGAGRDEKSFGEQLVRVWPEIA